MEDSEIQVRRLTFRSWHSGTQEIDLIFGPFAEHSLAGFSPLQLRRFEALLDSSDPELFGWVTGREKPPPAHDHDVMRLLQSFTCRQAKE